MNFRIIFSMLLLAALHAPIYAQVKDDTLPRDRDSRNLNNSNAEKLVYEFESGFHASNLRDLVESADIIALGRYGDHLGNFDFYGYDHTRIDPSTGYPTDKRGPSRASIPLSEYEIILDEIVKGETLVSAPLVLRIAELPDTSTISSVVEYRDGRHLFFFTLNPDGRTVGLHGPMFDMKEAGDLFVFDYDGHRLTSFNLGSKEEFLTKLYSIVQLP